jgi:hypothetical protein
MSQRIEINIFFRMKITSTLCQTSTDVAVRQSYRKITPERLPAINYSLPISGIQFHTGSTENHLIDRDRRISESWQDKAGGQGGIGVYLKTGNLKTITSPSISCKNRARPLKIHIFDIDITAKFYIFKNIKF